MDKKPQVSIIIPTYNRRGLIGRAMDSIFCQTYPDYEVIVVDDASTDGTAEFVSRSYPSARLIKLPHNRNAAGARNEGIGVAQGEFIAFLDSDDQWSPDFLEKSVKALQDNVSAVFSVCDCMVENKRWRSSPSPAYADPMYRQLMESIAVTMSSVVIRREALMKAGFLNEKLSITHDRELYLRLLYSGGLAYVPHALVNRFQQSDNLTRDYRRWAREVFLLLNIFFSDERSKPYIRFYRQAKSSWAFEMFNTARWRRDIKFAIKMLLKSFLSSPKTAARKTASIFKKRFFLYLPQDGLFYSSPLYATYHARIVLLPGSQTK